MRRSRCSWLLSVTMDKDVTENEAEVPCSCHRSILGAREPEPLPPEAQHLRLAVRLTMGKEGWTAGRFPRGLATSHGSFHKSRIASRSTARVAGARPWQ